MSTTTADIAVIGAGIAGASAAYALSKHARVVVLEREAIAGHHSTGRSAALYNAIGGPQPVRELTVASRHFLEAPPDDFDTSSLFAQRGLLFIAREDQSSMLEDFALRALQYPGWIRRLTRAETHALVPVLRPEHAVAAVYDENAYDIDVHGLHQGYLRSLKKRGGHLHLGTEVGSLQRRSGGWRVECGSMTVECGQVVNAAGAWADTIAERAGLEPLGLTPLRRTVITFLPQPPCDTRPWPAVINIDEDYYFKPDGAALLASPADETVQPPKDVQPQPIDIATAVDRIETATTMRVSKIQSSWAGLRTFADDRLPVIGPDPRSDGFHWLAGQGGFGIRTAPALAKELVAAIAGDGTADGRFGVERLLSRRLSEI